MLEAYTQDHSYSYSIRCTAINVSACNCLHIVIRKCEYGQDMCLSAFYMETRFAL